MSKPEPLEDIFTALVKKRLTREDKLKSLVADASCCVDSKTTDLFLKARDNNLEEAVDLFIQNQLMRKNLGLDKSYLSKLDPEKIRKSLLDNFAVVIPDQIDSKTNNLVVSYIPPPTTQASFPIDYLIAIIIALDSTIKRIAATSSSSSPVNGLDLLIDYTNASATTFNSENLDSILNIAASYPIKIESLIMLNTAWWVKIATKSLRCILPTNVVNVHTKYVTGKTIDTVVTRSVLPSCINGGLLDYNYGTWVNSLTEWIKTNSSVLSDKQSPLLLSSDLSDAADKADSHTKLNKLVLDPIKSTDAGDDNAMDIDVECGRSSSNDDINNNDNNRPKAHKKDGHFIDIKVAQSKDTDDSLTLDGSIYNNNKPIQSNFEGSLATRDDVPDLLKSSKTAVSKSQLQGFIRRLITENGFAKQFWWLSDQEMRQPRECLVAQLPKNKPLNRYTNVLAMDHSRVKLLGHENIAAGDDYINANYVRGYEDEIFISCQGPLENTANHFWQMVWEQKCYTIVMTTKCVENHRVKCHKYWPEIGQSIAYGLIQVTCATPKQDIHEAFSIQEINLKFIPDGSTRSIQHIHFHAWPDFGVPAKTQMVIDLLKITNDRQDALGKEFKEVGPSVIHCSAGIGRTGVLIALDTCFKYLKNYGFVDLLGTVHRLRQFRSGLIQTPEQLQFCYTALYDYMENDKMLEQ